MKWIVPVVLLAAASSHALAHDFTAGELKIGHPWSRETPRGAKVAGGYLTVTNQGKTADRLLSVAVSDKTAGRVEIHEMATVDGVMRMRMLPQGLPVKPGETVSLAPGGYHLMLMDLKAPLKNGDRVPVTLTFEKAGKVDVVINVEAMNSNPPQQNSKGGGHAGHLH